MGFANTWFFNSVLTESAGVAVTITSTQNSIDGSQAAEIAGNVAIAARGSVTVPRAFCFSQPTQHVLQSTWRGTDANGRAIVVTSPVVTLLARP